MSKIKIVVWVIILGLIVTLFLQNETLFLSKQPLSFDLYFINKLQTPELPVAVYFLAALIIGLLISYFFSLSDRFKSRKKIKGLITTLDTQREEVVILKKEVEGLKNAAPAAPTVASSVAPEPAAPVAPPTEPEITSKDDIKPWQPIESDTDEKPLSLSNIEESQDEAEEIKSNEGEDKH